MTGAETDNGGQRSDAGDRREEGRGETEGMLFMENGVKRYKILVLSDKEEMFEKVCGLLRKKSLYQIEYLGSFDEAYPLVQKNEVDFVFYDVHLALKDGVRKLDMMKEANSGVPVVVSAVLRHPPPGVGR